MGGVRHRATQLPVALLLLLLLWQPSDPHRESQPLPLLPCSPSDGRDVNDDTAVEWVERLHRDARALSDRTGTDVRIASGGGRMLVTMDRYEVRRRHGCTAARTCRCSASVVQRRHVLYSPAAIPN